LINVRQEIATICFSAVCQSSPKDFIPKDERDSILEMAKDMSMLTLIHYFGQSAKLTEERHSSESDTIMENKYEGMDGQPVSSMDATNSNQFPCPQHTDTGIMTFIPIASTPALQLLDRNTNQWIDIETLFPNHSHMVVMMGEKLSLFAGTIKCFQLFIPGTSRFSATVHRVVTFHLWRF
jgi:isopenicillin N synthase-like dioxygenase